MEKGVQIVSQAKEISNKICQLISLSWELGIEKIQWVDVTRNMINYTEDGIVSTTISELSRET